MRSPHMSLLCLKDNEQHVTTKYISHRISHANLDRKRQNFNPHKVYIKEQMSMGHSTSKVRKVFRKVIVMAGSSSICKLLIVEPSKLLFFVTSLLMPNSFHLFIQGCILTRQSSSAIGNLPLYIICTTMGGCRILKRGCR